MSVTTKLTLFGALAIALAAAAWLMWQGAGEEPTATPQALALPQPANEAEARAEKRAADDAALAHIAAESAAEQTFLPAEAPPGFEPVPPAPASAPQPPPGHSFTAFHGQMQTGRMAAADYPSVADAESADGYEWVSAASGVGALAAQGASANGRTWSFGWIGATPAADVGTDRGVSAGPGRRDARAQRPPAAVAVAGGRGATAADRRLARRCRHRPDAAGCQDRRAVPRAGGLASLGANAGLRHPDVGRSRRRLAPSARRPRRCGWPLRSRHARLCGQRSPRGALGADRGRLRACR